MGKSRAGCRHPGPRACVTHCPAHPNPNYSLLGFRVLFFSSCLILFFVCGKKPGLGLAHTPRRCGGQAQGRNSTDITTKQAEVQSSSCRTRVARACPPLAGNCDALKEALGRSWDAPGCSWGALRRFGSLLGRSVALLGRSAALIRGTPETFWGA